MSVLEKIKAEIEYAIPWNTEEKAMKQAVLDVIDKYAEQKVKTGRWIEREDYNLDTYYDCSVCGESWTTIDGTPLDNGMKFCPNCGAEMGVDE